MPFNFFTNSEQLMTAVSSLLILLVPSFHKFFLLNNRDNQKIEIYEDKRILFFDQVKGISIVGVIAIHTLLVFKLNHLGMDNIINISNNFLRFVIPCFLISTGMLLKPANVSGISQTLRFYLKKMFTIILPFFIANIMVALYTKISLETFLAYFMSGKMLTPYYYLIILSQFYLLYPLFIKLSRKHWFLYIAFTITLIAYFSPNTWHYQGIPLLFPYTFFFAYGIAHREDLLRNEYKNLNIVFLIFATGIYLFFCLFYTEYYYNMMYLYGITVWSILYMLRFKLANLYGISIIESLGKHSLGIYLVHFPITLLLFRYFSEVSIPAISMLLIVVCTILLSYIFMYLVYKSILKITFYT